MIGRSLLSQVEEGRKAKIRERGETRIYTDCNGMDAAIRVIVFVLGFARLGWFALTATTFGGWPLLLLLRGLLPRLRLWLGPRLRLRLLSWLRLWLRSRPFNWPAHPFRLWLYRSRRPFNLRSLLHRPRYAFSLRSLLLNRTRDLGLRSRSFNSATISAFHSRLRRRSTGDGPSAFRGPCIRNRPSTFGRTSAFSRRSTRKRPSISRRPSGLSLTSTFRGASSVSGSPRFRRSSTLSRWSTYDCRSIRRLRRATSLPFVANFELLTFRPIGNFLNTHRSCEVALEWRRYRRSARDHRRVLKFSRDARRDRNLAAAPR